MESSIFFDDDGIVEIKRQVSKTKFKTQKFFVGDIKSLKYKAPGFLSDGELNFILEGGTKCEPVRISREHKSLFKQLIRELEAAIIVARKSKPSTVTSSTPRSSSSKGMTPKSVSAVKKPQLSLGVDSAFVCLDIEWTDSSDPASICEIGLALFVDGELRDSYRSYVKPPFDYLIGKYEQRSNGISQTQIKTASTLAQQWEGIESFIGNRVLVLQNATNDVSKILHTLNASNFDKKLNFEYVDTMLMAKKLPWVTSRSGLSDLAKFFSLDRGYAHYDGRDKKAKNPHGAMEDAIVTGQILQRLLETCGYKSVYSLLGVLNAYSGRVRNSELVNGFSASGPMKYSTPSALPEESSVLKQVFRSMSLADKAEDKRIQGESKKQDFLSNPDWNKTRVTEGMTVCFTQLMSWDDDGNDHKAEVERVALSLGIKLIYGIRANLDLLVVNDPWVYDSAKLRDAMTRKVPVPVTTYSIFQQNNPDFPVWKYTKSAEYLELKDSGQWPENRAF